MLRVLIILLPLVLAVYALVDLVQTDDDDIRGLPKLAWVALIVLIYVVGPVAWLLAGKRSRNWLARLLPGGPAGTDPGHRTAPDDDPDFLRHLGRPSTPPPIPPTPPVDDDVTDEDHSDDRGPDDPPLTAR